MIEGMVVVLFGAALMFAEPAHGLLSTRRQDRQLDLGPILIAAIPIVPVDPGLVRLLSRLD